MSNKATSEAIPLVKMVLLSELELQSLVEKAASKAAGETFQLLQSLPSQTEEPYGDFKWLRTVCPLPAPTLRQWIACGYISGVKKLGKRLLFYKPEVLKWISDQHYKTSADHSLVAEESFRQKHDQI